MLFWTVGVTCAVIFVTLGRRRIDYRVVILGSLLPDLIDKPLGRILIPRLETSHVVGHTLLLSLTLLFGIQLFMRGDRARRWFVLPMAVMIHLALDGMWNEPRVLYWPLFGLQFPPFHVGSYWLFVLARLREPITIVQELVGLGILLYMAWAYRLFDRDIFRRFMRDGLLTERVKLPS